MIERTLYLDQIRPFIDKDVIKVLTGMRRSGKSTFLTQIRNQLLLRGISDSNVLMMNFESARFDYLTASYTDFYHEVLRFAANKTGKLYLLFDEIQMVDSWERAIASFRIDLDCDIYITGSNAKLLAGELATLLGGRYVSFEIMPFSFRELKEALPKNKQGEAFASFRTVGGLPFLAQIEFEPLESLVYLSDVFNSIILKDITQRKGFRDTEQLERVLHYFLSEIGTTFSAKNIANVLTEEKRSISRDTIYKYLAAAEEAMLFARVKRYDIKGKDILRGNEKLYVKDVGLREAIFGNNATRIDRVLENIVFNELKQRGYEVTFGKNGTKEVDFVAKKGADIIYLQVCYLLAHQETIDREFGAFEGIDDNFPKYVLSMDTVNFSQKGIRHFNIEEFLVSEAWQS